MKIIQDSNIIISALIKNGFTRKLIINKKLNLFAPSFMLSEIYKYKNEICKKSGISQEEFDILLEKLFNYIKIINVKYYKDRLDESKKLLDDPKDSPFLACALAIDAVIWSEDKHLHKQNKIKVLKTSEITSLLK